MRSISGGWHCGGTPFHLGAGAKHVAVLRSRREELLHIVVEAVNRTQRDAFLYHVQETLVVESRGSLSTIAITLRRTSGSRSDGLCADNAGASAPQAITSENSRGIANTVTRRDAAVCALDYGRSSASSVAPPIEDKTRRTFTG